MLRQKAKVLRNLNILLDICFTVLSFLLSIYLWEIMNGKPLSIGPVHFTLLLFIVPLWSIILFNAGVYYSQRIRNTFEICLRVLKTVLIGGMFLIAIIFIAKIQVSRGLIINFLLLNSILLVSQRMVVKSSLHKIRMKGYNNHHLLIVGTGKRARAFTRVIKEHKEWGYKIIGFVDDDLSKIGTEIDGIKVLGSIKDITALLNEFLIDEVIFIVPRKWINLMEDAIMSCEEVGIRTRLAADLFLNKIAKVSFDEMESWPLLTFDPVPHNMYALILKRTIDILFSLFILSITAALWMIIAILIKLETHGPIFFKQGRVGLHGRHFDIIKFRTMVKDAESFQAQLENLNESRGPVFKIKDDPRITRVGKLLRRLSLDELPQFINVLMGEMSIVGPRPPILGEVVKYDKWQRRRLSVKPGITCLWQVMGRNKIDFATWMKLDLQYIDTWSLSLDMKIIFKTINAVLRATGQ